MTKATQRDILTRLLAFFRAEFETEEQLGFPRLSRIPERFLQDRLKHYRLLSDAEKDWYKDCSAHFVYASHAFVVDAPNVDPKEHLYYDKWRAFTKTLMDDPNFRSVPTFRSMVQQYKIDKYRGVPSSVTEAQFAYASSIRPVKLSERRRRVKSALKGLGLINVDDLGYYRCRHEGKDFSVHVDFGGRHAQLRYVVSFPEFKNRHPLTQFGFERALGFGWGDWDFIVEENVDEVFGMFTEVVAYAAELPERIRRAI